jgi:hypothetical protein
MEFPRKEEALVMYRWFLYENRLPTKNSQLQRAFHRYIGYKGTTPQYKLSSEYKRIWRLYLVRRIKILKAQLESKTRIEYLKSNIIAARSGYLNYYRHLGNVSKRKKRVEQMDATQIQKLYGSKITNLNDFVFTARDQVFAYLNDKLKDAETKLEYSQMAREELEKELETLVGIDYTEEDDILEDIEKEEEERVQKEEDEEFERSQKKQKCSVCVLETMCKKIK